MNLTSSDTHLQDYFRTAYSMYFSDLIYMGLPSQEYQEGQAVLLDELRLPVRLPDSITSDTSFPAKLDEPIEMQIASCNLKYDQNTNLSSVDIGFVSADSNSLEVYAPIILNLTSLRRDKLRLLSSFEDYVLRYGSVRFDVLK